MCMMCFQTVDLDPCLDDSVMFARKLRSLGNKVTLDILSNLPHGFLNLLMVKLFDRKQVENYTFDFSLYRFVAGFKRGGGGCGSLCQKIERVAGAVTM